MNPDAVKEYVTERESKNESRRSGKLDRDRLEIVRQQFVNMVDVLQTDCDSKRQSAWDLILSEWTEEVEYVCVSDVVPAFCGSVSGRDEVRRKIEADQAVLEDQKPVVVREPEVEEDCVTLFIREEGRIRSTSECYAMEGAQRYVFDGLRIRSMELRIESYVTTDP